MAIDFPNSPTTNQDYTVGTTTWTYDGAKWILKTYNSLHAVPVTAMMLWANTTYPTGWLLADGSAISRTTYSDLFTAIGTTYGVGNGSTTFNLPSMTSAGTGSPNTIIKVTNSGALEPSAISHAANHTEGGSDVVTITGNQISNYQSYRNLIINGGMSVDQRRAGTALTAYNTTGSGFTADRFYCYMITDGAVTLQQVVDGPSNVSIYSSKVTVTTQDTSLSASQVADVATRLEGYSISNLAFGTASARPFVLSFWIKSSVTGMYGVSFRNGGAWNRRYIATYTVNAANTWEQKTIAITADTSGTWGTGSSLGIDIAWCLGAGTSESSTTGAWGAGAQVGANGQVNLLATLNATWQVTGVQLEAGPVATPFEFEPFETTVRKCQRYYTRFVGQSNTPIGTGVANSTSQTIAHVPFPVSMRKNIVTADVTQSGMTITDNINYDLAISSIPTVEGGPLGMRLFVNHAATATQYRVHHVMCINTSSFLAISAEL